MAMLNATHFDRGHLPWDENWKLDGKFFRDMEAWNGRQPDSTLPKVMGKVSDAVTRQQSFAELVPDPPFPARGLVISLAHLLALGVVRRLLLQPLLFLIVLCLDSSNGEDRSVPVYRRGDNLAYNG